MSVEKAKQTLEQTNNDLTAELKQTVTGKQEAERRRKAADTQLQETSVRLAETEAKSTELTEKVNKLQVWMGFRQLADTAFVKKLRNHGSVRAPVLLMSGISDYVVLLLDKSSMFGCCFSSLLSFLEFTSVENCCKI